MPDQPTHHHRFWSKVDIRGADQCWPWMAGSNPVGRGWFHKTGHGPVLAPRFAWEVTAGPIPPGMNVLHRCDNPACVNPAHLFIGTHADNMADMEAKGRARSPGCRGSHNGQAKLTEESVRALRARYAAGGVTQQQLAAEYGVNRTCISRVIAGVLWGHLDEERLSPREAV